MANDDDVDAPLDDAQLGQLVRHLEATEDASRESALESVESFEIWLKTHPALQQMPIVKSIRDIGPAILNFLRAMLGFDKPDKPSE